MPKLYELGLSIAVLALSTAAHCAAIDDDSVASLDAASSSATQLSHVQQLLQRLDDGPLDSALRTRLLRVLARL